MEKSIKEHYQKITSKGGKARAAKLSKERLSEIAQKAAKARWKGHKKKT